MKEYRIQDYKQAKASIDRYMKTKIDYAFIHYTCQGFYSNVCDRYPRIIAICILIPSSMQKHLFSIVSLAELYSIDLKNISEEQLDQLEIEMLKGFYSFVKGIKRDVTWLHWNMKDHCFGFSAIEHRYFKLAHAKKAPFVFRDDRQINLAMLLKQRYGNNYTKRPHLPNILALNNINPKNILTGEQEAAAYENKEFLSMERSLEDKISAFAEILEKSSNDELKTNSKVLRDIYGLSFKGMVTYLRENIILGMVSSLIGGIIVDLVVNLISKWLFE